jgi:hypothetical protein
VLILQQGGAFLLIWGTPNLREIHSEAFMAS